MACRKKRYRSTGTSHRKSFFAIFGIFGVIAALQFVDVALQQNLSSRAGLLVYPISTILVTLMLVWRRRMYVSVRHAAFAIAFGVFVALIRYLNGDEFWLDLGVWMFVGTLGALTMLKHANILKETLGFGRLFRSRRALGICLGLGIALGLINLNFDHAAGAPFLTQLPNWFALGLSAGLLEEMGIRLFILSLIVYSLGRMPHRRLEITLTYMLLIIPHSFLHLTGTAAAGEWASAISNTVSLAIIFGFPLSFLMMRYGVAAAVIAHTLIDTLRFLYSGGL
ncbi:hypothetical protein CSA80_00355 [Candidatus Saccharibacteria bacterium]|nr:MAG: hypothetical protein CSA80_00355 [Candidatus Saccharibacteria bacterium]